MDYFWALYEVSKAVTSSLHLSEVLSRLAQHTTTAMGVKGCVVRLLSPESDRLLFGAAYGLSESYLRKGPILVQESGVDQEAMSGAAVAIGDVTQDPRWQYPEEAEKEGITSVLTVPLRLRGELIGVMRVYSADRRRFTPTQREFLLAVANLGAVAIQNARLYEKSQEDFDELVREMDVRAALGTP